jgi:hypothetical protein
MARILNIPQLAVGGIREIRNWRFGKLSFDDPLRSLVFQGHKIEILYFSVAPGVVGRYFVLCHLWVRVNKMAT